MHNRSKLLKQLAKSIIEYGTITKETSEYVLNTLTRSEQKKLVQYLKNEYAKNTVTVTTATQPTADVTNTIKNTFKNKNIVYNVDENIIGGLVLQDNDDVFDASIRNYFAQTITKLNE